MIKAKDGEVTFRGTRSNIVAEAATVLRALKEELSEEEYKMVIRLADKSEEQLKDEAERARETLKKLLGL
jgi:F0F1-type ATP synthase membrane subunit b/b'